MISGIRVVLIGFKYYFCIRVFDYSLRTACISGVTAVRLDIPEEVISKWNIWREFSYSLDAILSPSQLQYSSEEP